MKPLWLVLVWVAALSGALALAIRSGDRYSVHDAEEHATAYGGSAREAHGPVTAFLWVCYAAVLVFTIGYSIAHRGDVVELFSMMGL